MEIAIGLVFYGLDDTGMTVAGIADTYSADEVQIGLSGSVVEVEPFCGHYLQPEWVWGCLCDMSEE
jgi:hypothetical protein